MVGNRRTAPEGKPPNEKLIPSWHFAIYGAGIVAAALLGVILIELTGPASRVGTPGGQDLEPARIDGGGR